MLRQVLQAVFEHRQVEARGPAQALDPGQEEPASRQQSAHTAHSSPDTNTWSKKTPKWYSQ
jgi:hypothetical protein